VLVYAIGEEESMRIVHKNGFQVIGLKAEAWWEELWEVMPAAWETLRSRYDQIFIEPMNH
jgi:predicted transcriptional regulator YdeE